MEAGQKPCIMCRRSTNRVGSTKRRSILLDYDFISQNSFLPEYIQHVDNSIKITEGSRICRPCFQRAQYWRRQTQKNVNDPEEVSEPHHDEADHTNKVRHVKVQTECDADGMEIPGYSRVPVNRRNCIFKGCNNTDLHKIQDDVRGDILLSKNIFIPHDTRVCDKHIVNSIWSEIENLTQDRLSDFNRTQIIEMLELQKRGSVVYL